MLYHGLDYKQDEKETFKAKAIKGYKTEWKLRNVTIIEGRKESGI